MDPTNVRVTSTAIAELPVDTRVQKAADDFTKGLFKTKKAAAVAWDAPYHAVRSRLAGAQPRSANGGNNTLLDPTEDLALHAWINLHMATGMRHSGCFDLLVN